MISIDRGPEPVELRAARRKHLARAMLAWASGGDIASCLTGYDAPGVRETLYQAQRMKCAYCERQQGQEGQPIEHFRPKDGAERLISVNPERWQTEAGPYFWLAWSWENLFFSCVTCNSRAKKGNKFPLRIGTAGLPAPPREHLASLPASSLDIESEARLLVDPAIDDPLDHIAWVPINHMSQPAEERWLWRPVKKTERGHWTIRVFRLDKDVADPVNDRIRHEVLPRIQKLRSLTSDGDRWAIQREWKRTLDALFAPRMPYQAAVYCAVDWFLKEEQRVRWGLTLRRPGAGSQARSRSSAAFIEPDGFAELPDELQLQIRAGQMNARDLCVRVREQRPAWTLAEIARILDLTEQTVRKHLDR